ncbi:molybdopterin-dependent oxidoreductase [bacterium]|nr:molybdopterin-dependent oxidoreductase [bacterium]
MRSLPQTKQTIDIHCVTRWSMLDMTFSGVLLKDLLTETGVKPNAKFVSFLARSKRNHATSLTLETAINLNTLIATEVNGEPIDITHGGPIRNIVETRYFYKSVKWLERIELLTADRLGFWEAESGYHNRADPWQEQRYMAPTIDRRTCLKLIETRDFSNRELRSIDASQRNLAGLNANRASLRDADFSGTDLSGADFSNANLSNAHFHNANLSNAVLVDADLEGADFSGADLRGANFTGTSLIGASFFTHKHGIAAGAKIDESTQLPPAAIAPLFPDQLHYVNNAIG